MPKPKATPAPSALAYSYIRFSTKEQRTGDSIRRQTALRDEFVERNGLTLDNSLRLIDDGVSAHRGKHRSDKHALGQFVALVRAGRIPAGSYLICESLDRLSREEVDEALELILSLTRAGLKVVQLHPVEVIYAKPVEPMKLMMGIMELSRGFSESRMKTERISASWESRREQARESGKAIAGWYPNWIQKVGDRYELIPDRARAVVRMFELSASGYGINGIIKQLNAEGFAPFKRGARKGDHWSASYIGKILASRHVLGEYQPTKGRKPIGDPILAYYPVAVSEELFYKARAGLQQRTHYPGGNKVNGVNLFQGLMRNAIDGDSIEYKFFHDYQKAGKGPRKARKHYSQARYVNALSLVAQAPAATFPVAQFEAAILSCLREVNPADILPGHDGSRDEVATLSAQVEEVDGQLREIEDRIVRGESIGVLVNAAKKLEAKKDELTAKLNDAKLKVMNPHSEAWGTCRTLIEVLDSCDDRDAAKLRLRQAIRRIVQGMWCVFVRQGETSLAAVQIRFEGGAHRDYMIESKPARRYASGLRPASWAVRSFASKGKGGELDLRDPKQAAAVAKVLETVEVAPSSVAPRRKPAAKKV